MPCFMIDLDVVLDVSYSVVDKVKRGRLYPIDLMSVTWRGEDVFKHLSVNDILTLQRRVLNRLDNEEN